MSKLTDELERLIEDVEKDRSAGTTVDSERFYTAGRLAGLRDALRLAQELETDPLATVDLTSALKAGDEVVALIDYMLVRRGDVGTVKRISTGEYPIQVEFGMDKLPYSNDGVVGFERNELGKV